MQSKKSVFGVILAGLKSFFTQNIGIKIVALLFAMILWGYVLTDTNPMRVKIIDNIPTSFEGEAELLAQGLCVRGDRQEILQKVSAQVKTQLANYADMGASSMSASISLRNISTIGEHQIPIRAYVSSGSGSVLSVMPSSIPVEIDSMVTKTIPVSCVTTGTLPDGYWADMDNLSYTQRIDIQGARTDIARVYRAVCNVDLSDKTATVFGTFDLVLYDSEDNVIDSGIVIGTIPSTTVRIPIYPVKAVPVNWEDSILGTDKVAANYEVTSIVPTPSEVRIVGIQSALDEVDSIGFEPVTVSGSSEPVTFDAPLIVPDNVRILDDPKVIVTVDIQEMQDELSFDDLKVEVTGLNENIAASIDPETVSLKMEGRVSLLSVIKRGDVKVEVDVTGLTEGNYELPLFFYVRDEATTAELIFTPSSEKVNVSLVWQVMPPHE